MNQEIKLKWLEKLRDPAARQLHYALGNDEGERCCLGVLCDIYAENKGKSWQPYDNKIISFFGEVEILPNSVCIWAGTERNPEVNFKGSERLLSELNDQERLTFLQIADLIEEQL